ncbi:MAG: hypothetical protein GY903_00665 [Fuerstiella sp.]|nr:hypothetical protein [Fuerstiella sp.]MCP4786038.1 hypothetical protein [Fuerstiella sp.]MCP4852989.1 hypothetical protein [Fuerstiella sp.]
MTENAPKNNGPRRFLVRPESTRESFRQTALRLYTALTGKEPTVEDLVEMEETLDRDFSPEESPPESPQV